MLHDLTAAELDGVPSLDLVRLAVTSHPDFKVVSESLDRRPADPMAAEFLVAAFARGEVPPWLTAHLLGQLRAAVGYDTVRAILLSAPGSLAESYAGPALARIRGQEAATDLVLILDTAPGLHSREGAAYGLGALDTPEAAEAVFRASAAGRIRAATGGWILGRMPFDQAAVASALLSGEDRLGAPKKTSRRRPADPRRPPALLGLGVQEHAVALAPWRARGSLAGSVRFF